MSAAYASAGAGYAVGARPARSTATLQRFPDDDRERDRDRSDDEGEDDEGHPVADPRGAEEPTDEDQQQRERHER